MATTFSDKSIAIWLQTCSVKMALTPHLTYRCDLTYANGMHEQISTDFQQEFEKTDWFIIS